MGRDVSRKVWLAKISAIDRRPGQLEMIIETFEARVRRALDPDQVVTRYHQDWRLSELEELPRSDGRRLIGAQLGFRRGKRDEQVDYDETNHVWNRQERSRDSANFAHFVIDLSTHVVAFEDRGQDLKRDTFVSVLGRFLESAQLEVNLLSDSREFEAWVQAVDRVTKFRVTVRPPNPGASARAKEIRELTLESGASRLTIEAESQDGLNVKDTVLDGAAEMASLGNGSYKATGIANGSKRFFDSAKRFLTRAVDLNTTDSRSTVESKLGDVLTDVSAQLPAHDQDAA